MKMISEMLLALLLSCFSSLDAVLAFFFNDDVKSEIFVGYCFTSDFFFSLDAVDFQ